MKREIKFRALTKANNVMVFGDLIICPDGEHRILWFRFKKNNLIYDSFNELVQTSTIGQYVGLKDDNDVEIYEDDIVVDINGNKLLVEWNDDKCKFQFSDGTDINDNERYNTYKVVIGNKYENPELLK